MNQEDKMLLNGVMSKLTEWEDNVQNLYGHVQRLEKLIIKQQEERPVSELEFIETRLRALENQTQTTLAMYHQLSVRVLDLQNKTPLVEFE